MSAPSPEIIAIEFGPKISALASRMIMRTDVAEEAAQEAWIEIIKSLPSFKGNSHISTWIYKIAKRTIWRYLKNELIISEQQFDNHFEKDFIDYTGEENERKQWVKDQCDRCLSAFCHCLNNDARFIFLLKEINELSYSQIAEIVELSEVNVRKIASRSKEKVMYFMNRDCILYSTKSNCRCRIAKEVRRIKYNEVYSGLHQTTQLVDFYLKAEEELPRKNFWNRKIQDIVTK